MAGRLTFRPRRSPVLHVVRGLLYGLLMLVSLRPAVARPAGLAADLVAEALAKNPEIRAARLRWEAAKASVPQMAAWPDPMLQTTNMVMVPMVSLSQTIPALGSLPAKEAQALQEALAAEADYRRTINGVRRRVQLATIDLLHAERLLDVIERSKALVRQLGHVATTRFAVGKASQHDALEAQLSLTELLHQQAMGRRERLSALTKLQATLTRPLETSWVQTQGLPMAADIEDETALVAAALVTNPEIAAAEARVAAATAGLDAARAQQFPDIDVALGFSPWDRAGMGAEGSGLTLSPQVMGMVGVPLPIWWGRRQAQAVVIAEASLSATAAERSAKQLDLEQMVHDTCAMIREQAELHQLHLQAELPQARQTLTAAVAGYQVGKVDFPAVIASQRRLLEIEERGLQIAADHARRVAELEEIVGRPVTKAEGHAEPMAD